MNACSVECSKRGFVGVDVEAGGCAVFGRAGAARVVVAVVVSLACVSHCECS